MNAVKCDSIVTASLGEAYTSVNKIKKHISGSDE